MKKLITALCISLGLSGLAVALTASPANAAACTTYYSFDDEWTELPFGGGKDMRTWTQITYYNCRNNNNGNRWVEPLIREFGYAVYDGDSGQRVGLDCSVSGSLQNVKYNFYFSDRAGHSINPGQGTLACSSDGANFNRTVMDSLNNPKLLHCGGPPKWNNDIQISLRLSTDKHLSHAGTMWGYGGLFPVHPNCP